MEFYIWNEVKISLIATKILFYSTSISKYFKPAITWSSIDVHLHDNQDFLKIPVFEIRALLFSKDSTC